MVDKSFENRRILRLSEIINYAKILTISVDMKQEKGKEILYLNNQKIDVTDFTVKEIRQEFFAYVFLKEWEGRQISSFEKQTKTFLTKNWIKE